MIWFKIFENFEDWLDEVNNLHDILWYNDLVWNVGEFWGLTWGSQQFAWYDNEVYTFN